MRILPLLFLAALPFARASNPDFSIIHQPANLVSDSLSGCIPLTQSLIYNNYGYGIHSKISAPRPFFKGAIEWDKGIETNHNLASVFGILVRPIDGTNVPGTPVEIHIKDWPVPAYSPHTRADVLAATIHCLLQSCYASPDLPLDLRIVTENKKDDAWAKPYAKKYITRPGKDNKPITPTPVGESILKTDPFGTRHVIFPGKNPKHLTPEKKPLILPVTTGGFEQEARPFHLIPIWVGNSTEVIKNLSLPHSHFYNIFPGFQFSLELNPLLGHQKAISIGTSIKKDAVETWLNIANQSAIDLGSGIAAAAINARLHHNKPLKITVRSDAGSETMAKLLKTPGWEPVEARYGKAATTVLEYDPERRTLSKGLLPDGLTIKSRPDGSIYFGSNHP